MKRPIKFRAWDKENEEMYHGFDLFYDGKETIQSLRHADWEVDDDFNPNGGFELVGAFILMQFTGLLCYDGQKWEEVYEGDILLKHGTHSVVEWCGIYLTKRIKTPKGIRNYHFQEIDFKDEDPRKLHGYRLVGNIHENPELVR